MNILDKIIQHKHKEVAERKALYPVKLLEKSIYFETSPVSFTEYLLRKDKLGIIAEIKRKSPSKGMINEYVNIEQVSIGYMQAGASALSVLTDTEFFGGKNEDLSIARKFNFCPILRKDFIIDEYQITEAKSIGADVVLLIAAALTPERTKELAKFAQEKGLEVLLEVHNEKEAKEFPSEFVNVVGVNNRNLEDFSVSLKTSEKLGEIIPNDFVKISESGIKAAEDIIQLQKQGYKGFLMGERFMQSASPENTCAEFIKSVQQKLAN